MLLWRPVLRTLRVHGFADYVVALEDALEPIFEQGEFPVVSRGDCSILLAVCWLSEWSAIRK